MGSNNVSSIFCDEEGNPIMTRDLLGKEGGPVIPRSSPGESSDLIAPISIDVSKHDDPSDLFVQGDDRDFIPDEDARRRLWERRQEAVISLTKEKVKNWIQEDSYNRRAEREYNRKRNYVDYRIRCGDAPLEMFRSYDMKIGSFRIVGGERKIAPMVIDEPELFFTRIKSLEAIDTPKIIKITWRGCKEPLYLVGERVNPYNMCKALELHMEIRASRRNRKEVVNSLFSFLMRESFNREERLHRHKGFIPDGRGGYIFVSGINELTIEEVLKRHGS